MLGCGHISHIINMHYFFKYHLLYSHALVRHTKYIVMITKEGSTKIINFMIPGVKVVVLGGAHILGHLVKMYFSLKHKSDKLGDQGMVYQNFKFHDPWGRGNFARAWPY